MLCTYTLVLTLQCICYIAYTIFAAFHSSIDSSLVMFSFSYI